jgi:hypothetical protein
MLREIRWWMPAFAAILVTACGDGGLSNTAGAGASGGSGGSGGGPITPASADRNVCTYAGNAGAERFEAAIALSDGTFLVGGSASNLDWIPDIVPREEMAMPGVDSAATGKIAFLMQLKPDLREALRVVHFPAGTVRDVRRIRTPSLPGQSTDFIYISGSRDAPSASEDGYYIARLEGFLNGKPVSVAWSYDVEAAGGAGESAFETLQPWDVGADGSVVFGLGAEYDFDWAAIQKLGPDGKRVAVEHWPAHWGASGEFLGLASQYPGGAPEYSAIVLKAGRRGSLRSTSAGDYALVQDDGNGMPKQGKMPDDYYFSGPCLPEPGECPGGTGYTGYSVSDRPTQRLGSVAVDRRTGSMYFGYSTQSRLPDGNPDFEPAVVAMDAAGELTWWSRLYHETNQNSSPDQYVDHVAIDYANDALVVVARAHGNNVINFWSGDKIAANPGAASFHNGFTGTNGDIHISWLGKLGLADGKLAAASWVAEYVDGMEGTGEPYADPNLDGWPDHNAGWPDLNTTRVSSMDVDTEGRVHLTGVGRRTITTKTAYQRMIKPVDGSSTWNSFVRVFSPSLDTLVYSSLIVGTWDPVDGNGGGNTTLDGIFPLDKGMIIVGRHDADEMTGAAKGNEVPTLQEPSWGRNVAAGESAIFAHLLYDPPQ